MIATACPFTGFQPSAKLRALSNDGAQGSIALLREIPLKAFGRALTCRPYFDKALSVI